MSLCEVEQEASPVSVLFLAAGLTSAERKETLNSVSARNCGELLDKQSHHAVADSNTVSHSRHHVGKALLCPLFRSGLGVFPSSPDQWPLWLLFS